MVQIVPTFIFLALHERTNFFHQLGAFKGGYWFTFALFVYFVLYITITKLTKYTFPNSPHIREGVGVGFALLISIIAFGYDINYHRFAGELGWGREALGFIGFVTWRYYLFFFLGTLVKKHFEKFCRMIESWLLVMSVVICFVVMALSPRYEAMIPAYLRFAMSGLCGMVMVFTFFRKFASWFTKERWLGRSLQYVGTRTLDVYLLHFFFLPESLLSYNRSLLAFDSKLLEVMIVLGEALLVLAACLIASYLLRLSPFLAKYLFGVKDR